MKASDALTKRVAPDYAHKLIKENKRVTVLHVLGGAATGLALYALSQAFDMLDWRGVAAVVVLVTAGVWAGRKR